MSDSECECANTCPILFAPTSTDLYFVAYFTVVVSDFCTHIVLNANTMRALLELKDPFGSK